LTVEIELSDRHMNLAELPGRLVMRGSRFVLTGAVVLALATFADGAQGQEANPPDGHGKELVAIADRHHG